MTTSRLAGFCPMGCGPSTLILQADGTVRCATVTCPDPEAVTKILSDPETEHIVVVAGSSWNVSHPLRERVNNELLDCELVRHISTLAIGIGHWRVMRVPGSALLSWDWEPLDSGPGGTRSSQEEPSAAETSREQYEAAMEEQVASEQRAVQHPYDDPDHGFDIHSVSGYEL